MTDCHGPEPLPRLAMLPLEVFAPSDAWIIDDADMGMAEHVQLYAAAEQIGDAHAELLQNPGSAKALSLRNAPISCFCWSELSSWPSVPRHAKLRAVSATTYRSCFLHIAGVA